MRFSDTNNRLRLSGATELRVSDCVMSLCVFVFILAGIVRKHRDHQTVSQACLSLYHSVSEYPSEWGQWAENTDQ